MTSIPASKHARLVKKEAKVKPTEVSPSLLSAAAVTASNAASRSQISEPQLASMRIACQRHLDHYMASKKGEKDFATFCRALARTTAEYRLPDTPGGRRSRMIGEFFEFASSMRRGVGRPKGSTEHADACLFAWDMINFERAEYGQRPLKRPPADQIATWLKAQGWLDLSADDVRRQLAGSPKPSRRMGGKRSGENSD
jgi:hypothetical protein